MFDGIMIGSECADWWERRSKAYHAELEEYVIENPSGFAVFVATAKATVVDFDRAMYFDLARIGEGAASGSLKGVLQDVFRVMSLIPEGRVLQGSKLLLGGVAQRITNLRVWRRLDGGFCVPIAIAQAMQRAGYRIGVGLSEVAAAIGLPLGSICCHGTPESLIKVALVRLGVQFKEIDAAALTTFDAVKALAGREAGPLLVGLNLANGKEGHQIVVGWTIGGIKIIDRYGIFNTLDELSAYYRRGSFVIDTGSPIYCFANAVIDPGLMGMVNQLGVFAVLVRQSLAVFDINFSRFASVDQLDEDFEKFLVRKGRKGTDNMPDMIVVGGFSVEVTLGDPNRSSLSGISKSQYGTTDLWPLIFDLNKDKIGGNPNRLKAGTKLLLLPIDRYTTSEIANARRRAPTWHNYPS